MRRSVKSLIDACVTAVLFLAVVLPMGFASIAPAVATDTFRCGSRLVSLDALTAQVAAVCGEPGLRDYAFDPLPGNRGYGSDIEMWTYNFGPNRLLQVLKFRNDRLIDVQSDGYGFFVPAEPRCAPGAIVEGLSKYRLLAQCGEPVSRRAEDVLAPLRLQRSDGGIYYNNKLLSPVHRERWVYNFGSSALLREVTLDNGRISEVDTGERGFDVQ